MKDFKQSPSKAIKVKELIAYLKNATQIPKYIIHWEVLVILNQFHISRKIFFTKNGPSIT